MTPDYALMAEQAVSLAEGSRSPLAMLANTASLLWLSLEDINWAGFYLLKGEELLLGPFQGKPACTVIPVGRGVCGTAAAERRVQLVPDVHAFPGHIACDSASRSEIVLPLIRAGRLLGVMDIDSPSPGRFTQADADGLARVCEVIAREADWDAGLL